MLLQCGRRDVTRAVFLAAGGTHLTSSGKAGTRGRAAHPQGADGGNVELVEMGALLFLMILQSNSSTSASISGLRELGPVAHPCHRCLLASGRGYQTTTRHEERQCSQTDTRVR